MIERLIRWLDLSTCSYLAVETIANELDMNGFLRLEESDKWNLEKGGKYYVVKNDTAIFAFTIGKNVIPEETSFKIISAHSDSPCFRIKPNAEIYGEGGCVSLNVEKYGGGILYTWFDRPLSISGRAIIKRGDKLTTEIFDLRKPIATVPHLAIHFNRQVNDGNPLSVQKDMKPVIGYFSKEDYDYYKEKGGVVKSEIAEYLGVTPEMIIDFEANLYPFENASLCGVSEEYIQSARIDDLSMAFAGLEAMLNEDITENGEINVLAIFDNEETGSTSRQGAASPVLKNILERILSNLGGDRESFFRSISRSFMISADDAHAWHPNYNEKYDPTNHPYIGGGPVIKINANGKYMTDSLGASKFKELCGRAHVRFQTFVNHGDVAGGSTLGNILTSQIDIAGVDVGNPIWAMHSARETAGVSDHEDMVKVFAQFWK